jgi:hypothetical protein
VAVRFSTKFILTSGPGPHNAERPIDQAAKRLLIPRKGVQASDVGDNELLKIDVATAKTLSNCTKDNEN